MKLQIMSPAADRVDFKVPPAPRLDSLEGKTIGLYNNITGGADIAVDRVAGGTLKSTLSAQQQVHSPMQFSLWMVPILLAVPTGTLVYLFSSHFPSPTLGKLLGVIVH